MKYLQLFSLELIHDYYADRRCPDFQIEPTAETQRLLVNCRSTLKSISNGVRAVIAADDQNAPFVPLPSNAVFTFHLFLQNPDFPLFTDYTELDQAMLPLFVSNGSGPVLDLTFREIKTTEHFVVRQPNKADVFVLSGNPLEGLKAADFVIDGLGKISNPSAYDETSKRITVNSAASTVGTPFTVMYSVAPQLSMGIFADVEIKYSDVSANLGEGANEFQAAFKAKDARWKYYLVADKTDSQPVPTIEDQDKIVVFDAADRTDLVQSPDASDPIAEELIEQYPDKQYFRFVSNALIPCQQTARSSIQLQLNGENVVGSLPNPSLQNYTIDLRNSKQEYTLHHVFKYLTHH